MRQVQNEKRYYKMYKKGRFWIFAGIAIATINMGTLTSRADAITAADETSSTSTSSEASDISQSQVALKQHDSSESSSTGSNGTVTNSSSVKTDTALTQAKSTEETTEQAQNDSAVKDDKSTTQTVSSSSYSQSESASGSQSSSDQSKANEIVNDTKEIVESNKQSDTEMPVTPVVTPNVTDGTPINTPKTDSIISVENEGTTKKTADAIGTVDSVSTPDVEVQLSKQQALTKLNLLTSNALGTAVVQKNKLSRASLMKAADVTELASGTWGTSPWRLTSDGLLTIGSGTFADDSMAPWEGNNYLPSGDRMRAVISKVVIDKNVVAGDYLSYLFFKKNTDPGNVPLTEIDGLENINVSHTTEMYGVFSSDSVSDFSGIKDWDTSNVTEMSAMFSSNPITDSSKLPIGNWNVGKVQYFNSMFSNMPIQSLDLSHWNVGAGGQKTWFGGMFLVDPQLKSLNISGWNMSNATQFSNMFSNDTALSSLTVSEKTRLGTDSGLPSVPTAEKTWQSMTGGDKYISTELMSLYGATSSNIPAGTITYVWEPASKSSFEVGPITVIAGPKSTWSAKDNVTSLVDGEGESIDLSSPIINNLVKVVSVNGNQYGTINVRTTNQSNQVVNMVVLAYTDSYGAVRQETTTVTVVKSQASLVGKDISVNMGIKPSWQASDAVDRTASSNAAGDPLTNIEAQTVTSTGLDLTKAGAQNVTLTYVDQYGNAVFTTVTVTMVASRADFKPSDVTIVAGDQAKWSWLDSVASATDFAGAPVATDELTKLAIVADKQPDLQTPGDYPITLTYTDSDGNVVTHVVQVKVVENKATIQTQPVQIIAGPSAKLDLKAALTKLTAVDGSDVAFENATLTATTDQLDLNTIGKQMVTVTYQDEAGYVHTAEIEITLVPSKAALTSKNSTIVIGPKTPAWTAAMNLTGAKDIDGHDLAIDAITVNGNVDVKTAGNYSITYSYTDSAGNIKQATAKVTVKASAADIAAKSTDLIAGPNTKWTAADNFVSATDAMGEKAEFNEVKVTGEVNPTKPGEYPVAYSYTDAAGNTVSQTVTIVVKTTKAAVKATDAIVIAGPGAEWTPETNFVSAQDANGQKIAFDQVKVDGAVDLHTPGNYTVTYQYTDVAGNLMTASITVKVVATKATLIAKDTAMIAGKGTWVPADNFVSATDAAGAPLTVDQITVDGQVDLQTPGTYQVIYRYLDSAHNQRTQTVTISVAKAQSGLVVKDSQLIAGPKTDWQPADNFVSATDADGQALSLKSVQVDGNVPTGTPGDYQITYHYTDSRGNEQVQTVTVKVIASQAAINVSDKTIVAGPKAKWTAQRNLDQVITADGRTIQGTTVTLNDQTDVKSATAMSVLASHLQPNVTTVIAAGEVNLSKTGQYQVHYVYTDQQGNTVTSVATVTIIASQANLQVKNSTVRVGATWQAADNILVAKDVNGQVVSIKKLAVTGRVDSAKAGTYPITYQYTDAAGNVFTAKAEVTVVAAMKPDTGSQDNQGTGDQINPDRPTNPTVPVEPSQPTKPTVTLDHSAVTEQVTTAADLVQPVATATVTSAKQMTPAKSQLDPIAQVTSAKLPQTNETQIGSNRILGLALLTLTGMAGLIGLGRKRRHN